MALHPPPTLAQKLQNHLKIAVFMLRKAASKRLLNTDRAMRGRKIFRKLLRKSLIFRRHSSRLPAPRECDFCVELGGIKTESFNVSSNFAYEISLGEELSPLPSPAPFSVFVFDYSSEEEREEGEGRARVDEEADVFIKKFYDELRAQR